MSILSDEVYCIANHGRLVATGGKDDKCLVWSADEGHILFECTGGIAANYTKYAFTRR